VTNEEAAFVEEMGQYLGSVGMSPMAGRMWAWLLICVPSEQTAAQLAEALQASKGSISGTARILETVGFVKRTRRRGDRREYFSAPPQAFRAILQGASNTYRRFREVTEHGLGVIADLPPPDRRRLQEVHDFVAFVEGELPKSLGRFAEDQARQAAEEAAEQEGRPRADTARAISA
jgi:DNA-binding transcriptional regulator GbsR (MarR family)